jgi:heptosyltransferase-1
MRVLIVKLSSMGDLVQALPAVTDAARALPGLQFDWVVDEAFAEIPRWHPAVANTIPSAHRRWRQRPLHCWRNGEIPTFLRHLRASRYDRVIDSQTNIKSAIVTALARGEKYGPDRHSVREWGAQFAYHHHVAVNTRQLAIRRWREMFAAILGYPLPTTACDFGLGARVWPAPAFAPPSQPFLICVTNASWTNKRWSDQHWAGLFALAGEYGYRILLPWGSEAEQLQARQLAEPFAHCEVLPRLSLTDLASLFRLSAGAVCNDTGLAHIAACLDTPVVTLYGPTDPGLIGASGAHSSHLLATGYDCIPCYRRQCSVPGYRGPQAQCLQTLAPQQVWAELLKQQALAANSDN